MRGLLAIGALLLLGHVLLAQAPDSSSPSSTPDSPQTSRVSLDQAGVKGGGLIHKVQPKYPRPAREAHIEGTVVLQASIGKDGRILDLRVISGPEQLTAPAIEAVRKWRYRPFLLENKAVEVETEIRVNFQLSP